MNINDVVKEIENKVLKRNRRRKYLPIIKEISISSLCGLAAGYVCKKTAKKALYAFGAAFITLQLLAYYGYVNVDWQRLENDALTKVRGTRSSRQMDMDELKAILKRFAKKLSYRLPSTASFTIFFLFGLSPYLP
jgi:uncharacterized membrane protein (Fun14 family)